MSALTKLLDAGCAAALDIEVLSFPQIDQLFFNLLAAGLVSFAKVRARSR